MSDKSTNWSYFRLDLHTHFSGKIAKLLATKEAEPPQVIGSKVLERFLDRIFAGLISDGSRYLIRVIITSLKLG
jgi:hypothetical protein